MKFTDQTAVNAKRENSSVVLWAEFHGKTFKNVSEENALKTMARGGKIYCDITTNPREVVVASTTKKSHDQIVIERHQRKLAGKGLAR